jgi:hypothetical protein
MGGVYERTPMATLLLLVVTYEGKWQGYYTTTGGLQLGKEPIIVGTGLRQRSLHRPHLSRSLSLPLVCSSLQYSAGARDAAGIWKQPHNEAGIVRHESTRLDVRLPAPVTLSCTYSPPRLCTTTFTITRDLTTAVIYDVPCP